MISAFDFRILVFNKASSMCVIRGNRANNNARIHSGTDKEGIW